MAEIRIVLDIEHLNFRLSNCSTEAGLNKRLAISFKRLNYIADGPDILIPYEEKTKIAILKEISDILAKFGLSQTLSEETSQDLANYAREEAMFRVFTEKARAIRNNEFYQDPQLLSDFNDFQSTVKRILTRQLYPLQLLSSFHMAFSQNSCNFSVPGAGKTSVVYAAYSFLKSLPENDLRHVDRLLVVGPLSSFAPWESEYYNCFGEKPKSQRLSGDLNTSRREKEEHLYSSRPAELTLIFHGGLDNFLKEILDFLKVNKTMVVIDEAHRIKNPEGVWGRTAIAISKEARARVILTGTPVPNGYEDLYNLYQFIYPFNFKNILSYHYSNLVDMSKNDIPTSERVNSFTNNISPYFIRIRKRDLRLPPKIDIIVEVEMKSHQREIYDFIETSYIKSFSENPSASIKDILNRAKLIRLRQASTNPALLAKSLKNCLANDQFSGEIDPNSRFTQFSDAFVDDSELFHKICNYIQLETPQKFIEIEKILTTQILSHSQKVIIWTIFIANAKDLQAYLSSQKIQSKCLIGETPQAEREEIISKFNDPNNSEFNVLIANPFCVAESISLHKGCHNAIYLERDYNCSNFLQSKDRIHRVGLSMDQITKYYYIISKNSIDGIINTRLEEKVERMEAVIDQDIPLFSRINDDDETDLIKALILEYARRS